MNYSESFDDIKNIVDSLPKEELLYICNGDFKDSPFSKYRCVLLIEDDPASFIEIYNLPDSEYNFIILATKEKYRNKSYSKKLYNKMIKEFNNSNNYPFMWRVEKNNIKSLEFAKTLGFKIINETKDKIELTSEV